MMARRLPGSPTGHAALAQRRYRADRGGLRWPLLALLLLAVGTGCAAQAALTAAPALRIERQAAPGFALAVITVEQRDAGLWIRGRVSRNPPRRGAIPGQILLRLLAPDGSVLAATVVAPMRPNRQASAATFSAWLAVEAPPAATLQVQHQRSAASLRESATAAQDG